MSRRAAVVFVAVTSLLALTAGVGHASNSSPPSATGVCNPPPAPTMPPAGDFVSGVDNRYFPLEPGTTLRYRGQEEGDRVLDTVTITHRTKTILGVRATVVFDYVELNGRPEEKTFDWYAQDKRGNVWYLGEAAFDYVKGHWMRADDSWEAGRDGAKPGILMEAHPKVGDTYTQEYYPGHAEDMAWVVDTNASVSVPYGTFDHALKTMECTPLEPGVVDVKKDVRGIGEVYEATVKGGSATLKLYSVTHH
jgi:hypothetical protein